MNEWRKIILHQWTFYMYQCTLYIVYSLLYQWTFLCQLYFPDNLALVGQITSLNPTTTNSSVTMSETQITRTTPHLQKCYDTTKTNAFTMASALIILCLPNKYMPIYAALGLWNPWCKMQPWAKLACAKILGLFKATLRIQGTKIQMNNKIKCYPLGCHDNPTA